MSDSYSLLEARASLGDLVIRAQGGESAVITRYGKPAAMLTSVGEHPDGNRDEAVDYRVIDRVRELAALHGTDAIRTYLTVAGLMKTSNSDEQVYSIAFGVMRSWATDLADLADRLAEPFQICIECRHVYRTPEDLQHEWTANAPPDLPGRETPPPAGKIYFCPLCQHDF
jgi:prevent-host-death family protein